MSEVELLSEIALHIKNFKSFGATGGYFPTIKPINIIIGRNNTGKSALIDTIEICTTKGASFDPAKHQHQGNKFELVITQPLDKRTLQQVFRPRTYGGDIPGNDHWHYGREYVGSRLSRLYTPAWKPKPLEGPAFKKIRPEAQEKILQQLCDVQGWPFDGFQLMKIAAERDVSPEERRQTRDIEPNGRGVTNLVRAFLNSDDLPREEVEFGLLADLNTVYLGDSCFDQIICQENEEVNTWEIFLREKNKGDIRLSQSGSSLKFIFIVLGMLRLVPLIKEIKWSQTIFAVEEPENNLHPSLLRRLLDFLSDQRQQKGFLLFLTTHSPIGIDWSARREDSQIIFVQHDGEAATSRVGIKYKDTKEIIEDLDFRASDILQANGLIWVEGPSDRIYLKHWISLFSDGALKEGTHYTIMFYGGKLLSHLDGLPPHENDALISLLSINRNTAVVIDSDRHKGGGKTPTGRDRKPRMNINATKQRIRNEIEGTGGYVWITSGREIENYIPDAVLERITRAKIPKKFDQFTDIPESKLFATMKGDKKIAIAVEATKDSTLAEFHNHLDLSERINELCDKIRRWNSIT